MISESTRSRWVSRLSAGALTLACLAVPTTPVMAQDVAFTIPEHDLYPESIAFDSVSGDFFLSSMSQSRILRIHPDGSYEDFVSPPTSPFPGAGSIGMKVDAGRRLLWVCTGRYFLFGGDAGSEPRTGVVLFNLDDGSVVRSWLVDQPSPPQIFNDLTLASDGSAYVTTTTFGKIYRLTPESGEMEPVHEAPAGSNNNGIALDAEERFLFFTLDRSLRRLDLATGDVIPLSAPDDVEVGTDGLYFVDGSLVVVKPRPRQVSRLFLNSTLDAVESAEHLATAHTDFVYPTTGVVVGDSLVFVATSFATVARDSLAGDQHPAVLIHRVALDPGPRD